MKRYDMKDGMLGSAMVEREDGDWVKHSDYAELAEVAKLAWRALCDAEAVLRTMTGDDSDESDKLGELRERVAASASHLFCVLALPVSDLSRIAT
jgi:hypothetical protein